MCRVLSYLLTWFASFSPHLGGRYQESRLRDGEGLREVKQLA